MVDEPITAVDVKALDPDYFKNRMEMMMADGGLEMMKMVLDIDPMHFVEIDDLTGLETTAELKPGGADVVVTEENKLEYVELLSEHYLCGAIRKELSQFLIGFHELVPENALKECGINEKDLALIITGMPVIDVADWRAHCEVETRTPGPEADALLARWWEVVQAMSPEEHAKLLQFATGLSRLPVGGFKQLEPPFKLSLNMQSPARKLPTGRSAPVGRRRKYETRMRMPPQITATATTATTTSAHVLQHCRRAAVPEHGGMSTQGQVRDPRGHRELRFCLSAHLGGGLERTGGAASQGAKTRAARPRCPPPL